MPYSPPATVRDTYTTLNTDGVIGNVMLRRFTLGGTEPMPTSIRCVATYGNDRPVAPEMQPTVTVTGRTFEVRYPSPAGLFEGKHTIYFGDRKVIGGRLRFSNETSSSPATLPGTITVQTQDGVDVFITVLVGASAGGGSLLPDLTLPIAANGQTRWNIGGGELRRGLFFNGVKMTKGVDYSITLPYLDWLSTVLIETSDELVLTN